MPVLSVLLAAAAIQAPAQMTPQTIREAIAFGAAQKEMPFYEIRKRGLMGSVYKPRLGSFTTPFLRVAQAAYNAKRQYKAFAETDVTPEMTAPELHVYGMAQANGAAISNVQTIVITPKDAHDPSKAIQPTAATEVPVQMRNLMGMSADGKSLMAVFPLDALREGNEVHIVYDAGVHDGGERKYCEDCFVDFKLDKVR